MLDEQLLKYYKAADESTSQAAAAEPSSKVGDSDMKGCISIQSCKVVALAPADAAARRAENERALFSVRRSALSPGLCWLWAALHSPEELRGRWAPLRARYRGGGGRPRTR